MNAPFAGTVNEIMRSVSEIRAFPAHCCPTLRNMAATRALCALISVEVGIYPYPAGAPPAPLEMAEALAKLMALMDEQVLFPQGEHDDLFDGSQTMVEGATSGPTVRAYRYSPIRRC
jgi:hypothetical protein